MMISESCNRGVSATENNDFNFDGRRVLFINSVNPMRMPFVSQQIELLQNHGIDIRVINRVAEPDSHIGPSVIYDGFLSKTPPFFGRLVSFLSAESRGLVDPAFKKFIWDVSDRRKLGRVAGSKHVYHWIKILDGLKSWRPELIHAHFAWHLPFAIPLGEYLDVPVICTAHHSDIYFEDDWAENLMHPRVREIISIAESVHGYMMERCPRLESKTTLIYNPINPEFLKPVVRRPVTRRILNVASFKSIKNQRWLVRALALLKARGEEFHCDLVGVGEELQSVQRLALDLGVSDRLTFHGFKAHSDVMRLMDSANVFVLSSESEGLPTVVTEALARELSVVATDLPSTRDATSRGQFGDLVPLNDDNALAESISKVLNGTNNGERKTSARCWIEAEFSHDVHWRKLRPVYLRVLS